MRPMSYFCFSRRAFARSEVVERPGVSSMKSGAS